MKKAALVFVLAVFVPSLVLAWLALRSSSHQKIIFERQQTLLYQGVCSSLAKEILNYIADLQTEFGREVETLLDERDTFDVAANFDERLLPAWPMAEVGFAVSASGSILSPPLLARPETKRFRLENDLFLCNKESVEVYWNSSKGTAVLSKAEGLPELSGSDGKESSKGLAGKGTEKFRAVSPQKDAVADGKSVSRLTSLQCPFGQLTAEGNQGVIGRFLQDRLNLLLWHRSPRASEIVFGTQLKLPALIAGLTNLIKVESPLDAQICVALLDDSANPVARSQAAFLAEWKRPFVSVEIGDMLPHWEIAAYLLNPARFSRTERTLRLTLGLVVALLVAAISVGGRLLYSDLRRQLTLARQKTDFVSNVSHELKTPLTSIRMFSELLAENRVTDEEKRKAYLNIITAEVARLTRLINNVLDFACIERGEKRYQLSSCDALRIVRETVESYRPQLEAKGFRVNCAVPDAQALFHGDPDALAQILLNLLSNAEKYSGEHKEVSVEARTWNGAQPGIEIKVSDRGIGVPRGCEEKIFEQFFRAHDSLSSGIQGSGLGLTLARQMARAHRGEIEYAPREGGGSCFTLRLPRIAKP